MLFDLRPRTVFNGPSVITQTVPFTFYQGCQHQIISGMITERHNIACRLIMKAIEAGSGEGGGVQMDIGSKDRLALQNLQIPVGSTNRTIPEWLFPRRFPTKLRLTNSCPHVT